MADVPAELEVSPGFLEQSEYTEVTHVIKATLDHVIKYLLKIKCSYCRRRSIRDCPSFCVPRHVISGCNDLAVIGC